MIPIGREVHFGLAFDFRKLPPARKSFVEVYREALETIQLAEPAKDAVDREQANDQQGCEFNQRFECDRDNQSAMLLPQ